MTKQLTVFSLLLAFVFIFISMTFDEASKTQSKNFIFSIFNEEPTLPATPYAYSDITFPSHIGNDTIETGYDGEVDTTILDLVDDNTSTLGRVLFYDQKLSALENISCASCHKQEFSFAEDKDLSEGISTLTKRNSLQLNDLGWTNTDGFFWDMSFSNLQDMISLPLKDPNEVGANMDDVVVKMYNTDYYADLFEAAYGDDDITEERIVDALTNFISSMVTFNSRFDNEANQGFSGFTSSENRGLELFQFNCATCHKEGNFSFGQFPNSNEIIFELPFLFSNGLETNPEDLGAGDWASGFEGLYKLPTMRNIELTGPYMHDGRFETLDDVIDFYSEDVVDANWSFLIPPGGFQFLDQEKVDLKNFLLTLTDESFTKDDKWSDPFASVVAVPEIEVINVSVSPNPMSTYAVITLDNPSNEKISLELFDEIGQLVKADEFTGESYQLDKNALVAGLYSVRLQGVNKMKTIKLIVQ